MAINDAEQVVGFGNGTSFVWDRQNGMRNLNTLLDPETGAGWVITSPRGINKNGQIICRGRYNGQAYSQALLLTPVPPPMVP